MSFSNPDRLTMLYLLVSDVESAINIKETSSFSFSGANVTQRVLSFAFSVFRFGSVWFSGFLGRIVLDVGTTIGEYMSKEDIGGDAGLGEILVSDEARVDLGTTGTICCVFGD